VKLGEFHVDAAGVHELVTDPDGPVGLLILELSERAAMVARSTVHTLPGTPRSGIWSLRSTAVWPSGTTRSSIDVHLPQIGSRGGMYGGVDTIYFPAVFLEFPPKGAVQMYDRYPFMTTGLDSLIGSV
jgi:hypothetical protein